jgi:hypothetical protein
MNFSEDSAIARVRWPKDVEGSEWNVEDGRAHIALGKLGVIDITFHDARITRKGDSLAKAFFRLPLKRLSRKRINRRPRYVTASASKIVRNSRNGAAAVARVWIAGEIVDGSMVQGRTRGIRCRSQFDPRLPARSGHGVLSSLLPFLSRVQVRYPLAGDFGCKSLKQTL